MFLLHMYVYRKGSRNLPEYQPLDACLCPYANESLFQSSNPLKIFYTTVIFLLLYSGFQFSLCLSHLFLK